MKKIVCIVVGVFQYLSQRFRSVRVNLMLISIKARLNSLLEPTPIIYLVQGLDDTAKQKIEQEARNEAARSLINYKDMCITPKECRFFFYRCSDESIHSRSLPVSFGSKNIQNRSRKLYITKGCILRVKGFRRIVKNCPFKSERELMIFEKGSSIQQQGKG